MDRESPANMPTQAAASGANTLIARSLSVVASEVDGELLVMNVEQGRYFALNDVAADIWRRLEPPCLFTSLVDDLAADYAASPADIAADVRVLLETMVTNGMIELRVA